MEYIAIAAVLAGVVLWLRANFLGLMLKEVKSPFGYDDTVVRLKESIAGKKGWHVFNVVDQGAEITRNGGAPAGRITIIQYCHGGFASRMFQTDERKKISAFSPKAISVYEKSDGAVYISMMNGELMKLVATGEMKEIVNEVSAEVKKIMSVLHRAPAAGRI
ncbi:MAG: DUF302 domain-containing protein [Elusimicrobiales bacterium]